MGRLNKYYCVNGSHSFLFSAKYRRFQKYKKYATPLTDKLDFMFLHKDDILTHAQKFYGFHARFGVYLATVKLLRMVWSVAKDHGTNKPRRLAFLHHDDPEPEIKMSSKCDWVPTIVYARKGEDYHVVLAPKVKR